MSSLGDQSEKNNNKLSDNVPLALHEILKENYESLVTKHENLVKEHETLIKTLELIEKTHKITLEDLVKKKQREALVGKEEIEKFDNEIAEIKKMQEMIDKDIEYLKSLIETEVNGMSSGPSSARVEGKKRNANKFASQEDVIEISDDDEGNQSESNIGNSNSSHQNIEYSFKL